MSDPMIEISDLDFIYPKSDIKTLNGVELIIDEGEYVAVVGKSGSGKSTLMSILGLINRATNGKYCIHGTNVNRLTNKSLSQLKNKEIGFIYQNFNLLNQLSVFENVALPLSYNKEIPRSQYQKKVTEVLSLVGMVEYVSRKPSQLSGGQQQRVAIARALVNDPSLILADEPTGNLDSKNSEQIFELISTLNKKGKTICLITHDDSFAKQAKKVFKISDGRITQCN